MDEVPAQLGECAPRSRRDPALAAILDPATQRRVAELEAAVLTVGDGRAAFGDYARHLVELLDADRGGAYGLRADEDRIRIDGFEAVNIDGAGYTRDFDETLRSHPFDSVAFNPIRPEPAHRNRVVQISADHRWSPTRLRGMSGLRERHPWLKADQLRVVICDGPAFLAWIGALRAAPFRRRERRVLRALVPALRRRLWVERQLAGAPLALGTLAAAVDAIAGAAFLLRAPAAVVHANGAGRALLEGEHGRAVERIRAATPGTWSWTPLSLPGLPPHWLVIRVQPPEDPAPRLAIVAHRAGLTTRQREVLSRLVVGEANKSTAFALGISEGAVERHVNALLERLGCDNRSEIVARFWSRDP